MCVHDIWQHVCFVLGFLCVFVSIHMCKHRETFWRRLPQHDLRCHHSHLMTWARSLTLKQYTVWAAGNSVGREMAKYWETDVDGELTTEGKREKEIERENYCTETVGSDGEKPEQMFYAEETSTARCEFLLSRHRKKEQGSEEKCSHYWAHFWMVDRVPNSYWRPHIDYQ